jgi:hypothetical protein
MKSNLFNRFVTFKYKNEVNSSGKMGQPLENKEFHKIITKV